MVRCRNTDCVPLTADGGVQSGPGSKGAWATSVHVPHEVSKDKIGQPINPVDYAVAVHSAEGASTSADLKVVDVVALKHRADLASHFRHRPLLIKIEVAPKA